MHDIVLMRVLDSRADAKQELESCRRVKPVCIAIIDQPLSFDVFHYKIGRAVLGRSAVEQSSDVRVIQRCENLPLVVETEVDMTGVHSALYELDGNSLF